MTRQVLDVDAGDPILDCQRPQRRVGTRSVRPQTMHGKEPTGQQRPDRQSEQAAKACGVGGGTGHQA